ncbi:MAG: hypothetical protein M3478_13730 [Planctomycetota bacterium]|nr:hypothetical protein [Planctomycetota bacterium]
MVAAPIHLPVGNTAGARAPVARRLMLCLIVVLGLLAVRLIWGHYTARAVRAEVEALRARGEPLEVGDFPFVEVPDAENAAKYHQDAAAAAVPGVDSPRATNMVYAGYPPFDAEWMAAAEGSEGAHGKLFALAREARRHRRVQWDPKPMTGPLVAQWRGNLNATRHLANLLADGATLAHVRGDDVEAIERIRDLLHLARSVRHDDTLISQLVGAGIDALTCDATMILAPGLRLDASSGATSAPATRAAVQALIAELLDEDMLRRGFVQGLRFERAITHELVQKKGAGTWVIRPLVSTQLLRDHRNFDVYLEAAALPDKPRVMAAFGRVSSQSPIGRTGDMPRYSRWFGDMQNTQRYFETRFRLTGERRVAATSLAAQHFRAEHARWPTALAELVPAYLPAVPLDPYKVDEPLGYVVFPRALPDGRDRPMLFFRASETVDNDIGPYPEPMYGWENARTLVRRIIWQYRDLSRFIPPPASTQAVDDQP